ncbi:MEKK [Handroanthus impetiginosus]|uniref:MEKK n=1 Tax=Handroanthus impetiginosus TaxID=429701 RepID=A0A2G9G0U8_9LAMI|nr:MEKK [Handroanthus impetiginosus]
MDQSTRRYSVVGDYKVVKQIGIGSFSTVWQARHRVHGTEVAIKEIITARLDARLHERLKSEIIFLKRISHPNIIRLHDMIEESGKIYIVLEYCKGGDLSMYLRQRQGKIPEATAKHFMQQLAEGLKVLRDNNLIHRDLKPQNLLLSSNGDNSILKIADFGLARYLQPTGLAETLCGSPLYMAPEVMQQKKYDAKADLWSVGVILFQLVTGKTPFTGRSQFELLQNILKSTELQFPPEAKELSPQYMDLCKKLLRPPAVLYYAASRISGLIDAAINFQLEGGKQLEAFSIQLVILAIWKQALHICHTNAASAIEGSPSHETRRFRDKVHSPDVQESLGIPNVQGLRDICLQIERAFLREVEHAEELAKAIEPGNLEMPDAMELIYQSAIDLGKRGAVDEYLGEVESAAVYYSKAVRLLQFLLVEAPCLIMNPPFSLTSSDRYRIKNYIDVLNNRQSFSRSQRMALFKG